MSPAPLADYGTCNECGTPMRAARSYGSADPNTRPRKREGLCIPCYGTIRRGGAPQPAPATPDPAAEERRDRENAQALQAWLRWRRNRGVPEQGYLAA
jgi:hypothetical protein